MLSKYNLLRKIYHQKGYQIALQFIDQQSTITSQQQILSVNMYCYLMIQKNYQPDKIQELLKSCLQRQNQCQGILKALTLHQFSNLFIILDDFQRSHQFSQKLVNQFIGQYYILKNKRDNSSQQEALKQQFQQILYYSFATLSYIAQQNNKENQSQEFTKAGQKLIKNKEVLYLKSPSKKQKIDK